MNMNLAKVSFVALLATSVCCVAGAKQPVTPIEQAQAGQATSQVASKAGQAQAQHDQVASQKAQVQAQTQEATQSAMNQSVQQTQNTANTLRSNASAVAQSESQMVQETKA
jgi:hypothetical protein